MNPGCVFTLRDVGLDAREIDIRVYVRILRNQRLELSLNARPANRENSRLSNKYCTCTDMNKHVSSSRAPSQTVGILNRSSDPRFPTAQHLADSYPTSRATTFPAKYQHTDGSQAIRDSLQAPYEKPKKRSTSPVGRLKGVLKARRSANNINISWKRSDSSLNKSKIAADSSRGIVTSRIGLKLPDKRDSSPRLPTTPKTFFPEAYTPPRTPEKKAPQIIETTPTPTENSGPRFSEVRERSSSEIEVTRPDVVNSLPEVPMLSSRSRTRSGSATLAQSKPSNTTPSPKVTAGSVSPSQGGFFSSVISAAQNAANTLSNSIGNNSTSGNKSKVGSLDSKIGASLEVETVSEKKEPAVKTLGMGDLSLSHLGISENSTDTGTNSSFKLSDLSKKKLETAKDEPTMSVPRSFTTGNIGITNQNISSSALDEFHYSNRPRTAYETFDQTPPNGSIFEEKSGPQRSNSTRSGIVNRGKRGNSAATSGTTIAAAIAAANGSLGTNSLSAPKVTGFAVASKKRNKDFHQLFRSVPDDDYLIEDYSCALQREILAHGRLYVSEGHLCFSSNIFGWVTTLVMSFDEIVSIEKRSTALLFKNGLMISTLHAKNVFASFTSRDSTYDLIIGIWKLGHPTLRSSLNGAHIAETSRFDKIEKDNGNAARSSQSESGFESDGEDDDDIFNEDGEGEDGMSFTHVEGNLPESDVSQKKVVTKKNSGAVSLNNVSTENIKEVDNSKITTPDVFPGPLTHSPTDCSELENPYPKTILDDLIPAPLGKVWSYTFGHAAYIWFRNFITVEQKCLEYTLEENAKKPLGPDNKVRNYSYIKPLYGAIGPKQTKCICTETLEFLDFEKFVSVSISTQTPDVPSGNVFCTKTRYCFSWGENNSTRLQMSFFVEWTGKSWLKGPIEKGAGDGQLQYARDIVTALKNTVSSRRSMAILTPKNKKTRRKCKEQKSNGHVTDSTTEPARATQEWRIFSLAETYLGPILSILRPLLAGNILYSLLVGLLVGSWFRFGFIGNVHYKPRSSLTDVQRTVAYEEMWRSEESELWKWLEDRVGTDKLRDINSMPQEKRDMDNKLQVEAHLRAVHMEDAIRVTEERLGLLKNLEAARAKNRG
ncbi:hypothetical protein K3495_g6374 [Podosphaera aphanis]|nr:hypothetical protein K3495_g6374 [Podosphaera aphanis]